MYGPLWKDLTHSSIASMFDFEQVHTGSSVINFDIMISETTSYNDSSTICIVVLVLSRFIVSMFQ